MKNQKKWCKSWNRSVQPRKQRKYISNAPLHVKSSLLCSHLSKELREKHKIRSIRVKKGDKVKVMTGQFKGVIGKVDKVDTKKSKLYIVGVDQLKLDGTKAQYPVHSSNVLIVELDLNDRKRLGEKK
jgi:large subunit ribosomal protein L24